MQAGRAPEARGIVAGAGVGMGLLAGGTLMLSTWLGAADGIAEGATTGPATKPAPAGAVTVTFGEPAQLAPNTRNVWEVRASLEVTNNTDQVQSFAGKVTLTRDGYTLDLGRFEAYRIEPHGATNTGVSVELPKGEPTPDLSGATLSASDLVTIAVD